MNTILTDLTKKIGETIAKIQVNNKLLEDLQKKCNPTFLEILDDVKDNNPSLAASLLLWYGNKYKVNNSEIIKLLDSLKKEDDSIDYDSGCSSSKPKKKNKSTFYSSSCGYSLGCGYTSHYDDRC